MRTLLVGLLALLLLAGGAASAPVGTSFTYQGELTDSGSPVTSADLRFALRDAPSAGAAVGLPVQIDDVAVVDGRFTVTLDFGDVWDGDARWIEIEVRSPHDPSDTQPFTTLDPRQALTGAPYAQHAANGNWSRSGSTITNENTGFVGINRDYPVGSEWFGVHAPVSAGYGGMYVTTEGTDAKPFYGYYTPGEVGWHYLDGATGDWHLNLDGDRLTVTDLGMVGIGITAPTERLQVSGVVESTTGGFKFPDGTVQATAAESASGDGHSLDSADGNSIDVVLVNNLGRTVVADDLGVGISPLHRLHVDEATASFNVVHLERSLDATSSSDLLELEMGGASDAATQFIEAQLSTGDIKFRVWADGDVSADGVLTGGGADFAEVVKVTSGAASVEAGDVMVIDPRSRRGFARATEARSTLVAGIYSTAPGFLASEHDWDQLAVEIGMVPQARGENEEAPAVKPLEVGARIDEVPLAVVGIVPCKVSAENGAVQAGDLLVTAATAGHAMRDENPRVGTVLGKALEPLAAGTGVILVMVTLQ